MALRTSVADGNAIVVENWSGVDREHWLIGATAWRKLLIRKTRLVRQWICLSYDAATTYVSAHDSENCELAIYEDQRALKSYILTRTSEADTVVVKDSGTLA